NALNHGVAVTAGPATVEIAASRQGSSLAIAITDKGQSVAVPSRPERQGIGLSNTRLRLEQLYGKDQSLILEKIPGRGTRISIELPWHAVPEHTAAVAPSVAWGAT